MDNYTTLMTEHPMVLAVVVMIKRQVISFQEILVADLVGQILESLMSTDRFAL